MRVALYVAAGLILILECLELSLTGVKAWTSSDKDPCSDKEFEKDNPDRCYRRRTGEGRCSTGCAPAIDIANDQIIKVREMFEQGMESKEVLEWVVEKTQDTCVRKLMSELDVANESVLYEMDGYWQCMAYSEMAKRADPDYALFAWIQEYLNSEDIDPHAGCGDMVLQVTELAIKNKIPGVNANLKDRTFTIENFARKNDLRENLGRFPEIMFGLGIMSLLTKGTEIVANMCFDYIGRVDADVTGFIDLATEETA